MKIYKQYICVAVCLFFLNGCSTGYNLATNKEEFMFISQAKEVKIGKSIARHVERKLKLDEDAVLQERVAEIGEKLAQVCDRKTIVYHFKVLADEENKNAFALPGGYVYIFRGLLNALETDDEIAAVLGHEIGHIAARHSIKRQQASVEYSVLMAALASQTDTKTQVDISKAVAHLFLSYSREDELLADNLAVKYLRRAGYNSEAALTVLEKLSQIQKEEPIRKYRKFRAHPYLSQRIAAMRAKLSGRVDFESYINLPAETE
jgi:predicted Zn-dependent protease